LMEAAHVVCPYSNATRGNIEVKLMPSNEVSASGRCSARSITHVATKAGCDS